MTRNSLKNIVIVAFALASIGVMGISNEDDVNAELSNSEIRLKDFNRERSDYLTLKDSVMGLELNLLKCLIDGNNDRQSLSSSNKLGEYSNEGAIKNSIQVNETPKFKYYYDKQKRVLLQIVSLGGQHACAVYSQLGTPISLAIYK